MPLMQTGKQIGIIILAAGGSSRMGSAKQLLMHKDQQTMVRHMAETALKTEHRPVIAVLGSVVEKIKQELNGFDINFVINAQWSDGISSSIKAGLAEIRMLQPALDAILFLACDQPFVNASIIEKIATKYIQTGKPMVACQYRKHMGIPALFDQSFFSHLMQLEGDRGAGILFHQFPDQVALVTFEEGAFDIDTEEDYELYLM